MKRILLIGDCEHLARAMMESLEPDYNVTHAPRLGTAHALLERHDFDLILLDLQLPDGSGYDFCKAIRARSRTSSTPILMISGRVETSDRVVGLDLGADDYLTKPFHPDELHARVRARLRQGSREQSRTLSRGPFFIDLKSQKVYFSEGEVRRDLDLTPLEYKLLFFLLDGGDGPISRERLIEVCQGSDYNINARSIDVHIHSIRKKIGDQTYIHTIYGKGYLIKVA